MRLWDLYNLVAILVEFDMDSLLLFPPHFRRSFGLVINQSVGSCRVELIPEVGVIFRCLLLKVISNLICTLYNLCIVFWYYPLFIVICEIWSLKLTYGAYLVLSLKSGIALHLLVTLSITFLEQQSTYAWMIAQCIQCQMETLKICVEWPSCSFWSNFFRARLSTYFIKQKRVQNTNYLVTNTLPNLFLLDPGIKHYMLPQIATDYKTQQIFAPATLPDVRSQPHTICQLHLWWLKLASACL